MNSEPRIVIQVPGLDEWMEKEATADALRAYAQLKRAMLDELNQNPSAPPRDAFFEISIDQDVLVEAAMKRIESCDIALVHPFLKQWLNR